MKNVEILEVAETTLEEWLELMRKPPANKLFVRNKFPTDRHKDEWMSSAHARPESDVRLLLRKFLVSTGTNELDRLNAPYTLAQFRSKGPGVELSEHDMRLLYYVASGGKYPVWEGLGWVIDLLPHRPRMALNVIDAFVFACAGRLTDNYLEGQFDAMSIIRNRYIESAHTVDRAKRVLLGLDWRELEWLCGVAYEHMGFSVEVTPPGNDDGVDVFATSELLGKKGRVVIQAKKWAEQNPVGKKEVRELIGTVDSQRATSGVLVTTGRFEAGAHSMAASDSRIELLECDQMLQLLNEYCGTDWFLRLDLLLSQVRRRDTNKHQPSVGTGGTP